MSRWYTERARQKDRNLDLHILYISTNMTYTIYTWNAVLLTIKNWGLSTIQLNISLNHSKTISIKDIVDFFKDNYDWFLYYVKTIYTYIYKRIKDIFIYILCKMK